MTFTSSVAVLGLGYVGLPVAIAASKSGFSVVGFDPASSLVSGLNAGFSHIDDIADVEIASAIEAGFFATDQVKHLVAPSIYVVCVPTPLQDNGEPDLSAVLAAGESIAANLSAGDLVILESTTYPGTTDGPFRRVLESNGLTAGSDFGLAYSPERIDPGNPSFNLNNTPKVVGGLTEECRDRAADFYRNFVTEVVLVSGLREAEMTKILENSYRQVNIALANEFSIISRDLGIDIWNVISAAQTKPFGFSAFYPGPGVGGHCIPIDPMYLAHIVKVGGSSFQIIELAQKINKSMPSVVVDTISLLLAEDNLVRESARVLLLGLTYKPDTSDDRESPAAEIYASLRGRGFKVSAHDPFLKVFECGDISVEVVEDLKQAIEESDLVVLLQNHSAYSTVDFESAKQILDTRGVIPLRSNVSRL